MNKFRIYFRRTAFGGSKKITDVRDFRTMTRNPFTGQCATLTSAKKIVETILDNGASLTALEVTIEECATILTNWMKPDFCPDGWTIEKTESIEVQPTALTIDYYG